MTLMIMSLGLFVVLQAVDVWTTLRAFLRNPAVYEANPALVVVKLVVSSVVSWVALSYAREEAMLAMVAVLCAVYSAIAVSNWRQA